MKIGEGIVNSEEEKERKVVRDLLGYFEKNIEDKMVTPSVDRKKDLIGEKRSQRKKQIGIFLSSGKKKSYRKRRKEATRFLFISAKRLKFGDF